MQAVLLDALGTLVELEPPWERLAGEPERVRAAFRAEMAYYRGHSLEGRDEASLADLRGRCTELLSEGVGREVGVPEMMDAIQFRAFDDAAPALGELRERGLRLVCVSNWDYSLPEVLARVGLLESLDGVVTSAGVAVAKPDPRIFREALRMARCDASEALHVGDSSEEDVRGASAAGIRALLLDRSGGGDIASLTEIPAIADGSVTMPAS
jgi:putative hydrolase of the HAD superfamily